MNKFKKNLTQIKPWDPPIILKELYRELHLPLTQFFNKSLHEGHVYSEWKIAEVTAVY